MRRQAFSQDQTDQVIYLYEQKNHGVDFIAAELDVSHSTVWRTLKRHGVKLRMQNKFKHVDTAEVIQRYLNGENSNAIGESYGMTGESIRYRLRRAGVPIRAKSEAAKLRGDEWTPERVDLLKELWVAGMNSAKIRDRLGINYCRQTICAKAKELGLRPRLTHKKSPSEISTLASAKVFARDYRQDSIISFLPENPQLDADWRHVLSKVRQERAAANEAARV